MEAEFILAPLLVCTQVCVLEGIFSEDLEMLSLGNNGLFLYPLVRFIMLSWQSFPYSKGDGRWLPIKGITFRCLVSNLLSSYTLS